MQWNARRDRLVIVPHSEPGGLILPEVRGNTALAKAQAGWERTPTGTKPVARYGFTRASRA